MLRDMGFFPDLDSRSFRIYRRRLVCSFFIVARRQKIACLDYRIIEDTSVQQGIKWIHQ